MTNNLIYVKVKDVRRETSDCISIVFTKPVGFDFTPGECADLSFPDQKLLFKTFSFASSPTENDLIITFRKGWTEYKTRLEKLAWGNQMLMRVYGNTFNFLPKHKAVFIAGGIGITPFRAMLVFEKNKLSQKEKGQNIILIYLNATQEFVFKQELDELQRELNNFEVNYILTQREGRLSREKLLKLVCFDSDTINYISGPPGMVDATVEILEKMKIENIRIKTASFDGYLGE